MKVCHDCLAQEGEIHEEGCDMEICIKCGKQKLCCGCNYNMKREPYFEVPNICNKCGELFPEMFMVSNEDWKFVCGVIFKLDCMLCKKCYNFIKEKREKDKDD